MPKLSILRQTDILLFLFNIAHTRSLEPQGDVSERGSSDHDADITSPPTDRVLHRGVQTVQVTSCPNLPARPGTRLQLSHRRLGGHVIQWEQQQLLS